MAQSREVTAEEAENEDSTYVLKAEAPELVDGTIVRDER